MKRIGIFALVLGYLLCLMLAGCRPSGVGQASDTTVDDSTAEDTVLDFTQVSDPDVTVPKDGIGDTPAGSPISIGGTGKVRISYSGNYNSVRYVTSVSELPDNEALKQYDDAWFQDHALVLVVETVGSGSVDVGFESIYLEGNIATVTLSHEMQGDGTSDMATWLLWAEVEVGLDCQWNLANPAVESDASKY